MKIRKKYKIFFKKGLTKWFWYAIITIVAEKSVYTVRWCGSMAEQLICNQQVVGSTPITSSTGHSLACDPYIWERSRAAKGDRL